MDAFVALNQQRLAEMVQQRKELNALRTVHREIDTEYERALNEDKQREFERKEREILQNKIEESITREREKLETDRKFAEKMFSQKEYQADDCLPVAIRLLNGKRISRRFSPNDTIKVFFLTIPNKSLHFLFSILFSTIVYYFLFIIIFLNFTHV